MNNRKEMKINPWLRTCQLGIGPFCKLRINLCRSHRGRVKLIQHGRWPQDDCYIFCHGMKMRLHWAGRWVRIKVCSYSMMASRCQSTRNDTLRTSPNPRLKLVMWPNKPLRLFQVVLLLFNLTTMFYTTSCCPFYTNRYAAQSSAHYWNNWIAMIEFRPDQSAHASRYGTENEVSSICIIYALKHIWRRTRDIIATSLVQEFRFFKGLDAYMNLLTLAHRYKQKLK